VWGFDGKWTSFYRCWHMAWEHEISFVDDFAILACVILDVYATFVMGKKSRMLFFIPVILAGVRMLFTSHHFSLFFIFSRASSTRTSASLRLYRGCLSYLRLAGFVSGEHAKALLREEKRRAEEIRKRIKAEKTTWNRYLKACLTVCISADYKVEFMNEVLRRIFGDHVGDICYKVFHNREEPCQRP